MLANSSGLPTRPSGMSAVTVGKYSSNVFPTCLARPPMWERSRSVRMRPGQTVLIRMLSFPSSAASVFDIPATAHWGGGPPHGRGGRWRPGGPRRPPANRRRSFDRNRREAGRRRSRPGYPRRRRPPRALRPPAGCRRAASRRRGGPAPPPWSAPGSRWRPQSDRPPFARTSSPGHPRRPAPWRWPCPSPCSPPPRSQPSLSVPDPCLSPPLLVETGAVRAENLHALQLAVAHDLQLDLFPRPVAPEGEVEPLPARHLLLVHRDDEVALP